MAGDPSYAIVQFQCPSSILLSSAADAQRVDQTKPHFRTQENTPDSGARIILLSMSAGRNMRITTSKEPSTGRVLHSRRASRSVAMIGGILSVEVGAFS